MIFMHSENVAPRLQLAFLTGQSNPSCCALSPAQQTFGQALLAPGRVLHPRNFPYWPDTPTHQATPLWRASWCNTAHYLRSRRPDFAQRHAQDVLRLLAGASHTVLLAGSCGLELLANLHLPPEASRQISVLAYGPVARRAPACARLLSVAGRHDWISRLGYGRAMVNIDAGHMDYLQQTEMQTLARQFVADVERDLA